MQEKYQNEDAREGQYASFQAPAKKREGNAHVTGHHLNITTISASLAHFQNNVHKTLQESTMHKRELNNNMTDL